MGLEIVEQVPDLDACIIPVGGGGLIAGSALAIKSLRPNVMIIVSTVMILSFWRDRSGQTVKTKIRLLVYSISVFLAFPLCLGFRVFIANLVSCPIIKVFFINLNT